MALLEAGDHLPGVTPSWARPRRPRRTRARPPGAGRATPAATALACPKHLSPDSTQRARPLRGHALPAFEGGPWRGRRVLARVVWAGKGRAHSAHPKPRPAVSGGRTRGDTVQRSPSAAALPALVPPRESRLRCGRDA